MVIELGEKPTPEIEPAEPNPGGVDAIEDDTAGSPVVPDISLIGNEAIDQDVPDELTEPEDTDEGARSDGASEPEQETQA
jgi:hypothetical protein